MDSAFIHQAANELVQNAGTRNIKQIARSCSLDISETSHIKDMLGLLSLYFDKPLILINRQLDKQTKQMVCGYALGHYLEHQLLMDLHTLNKFLTIKDKHILLYEHNAFTSHLMLDSDEVYQMTRRGLDAAQIAAVKKIHLNCAGEIAGTAPSGVRSASLPRPASCVYQAVQPSGTFSV